MKRSVRNMLCALLCAACLCAVIPMAAHAAPADLRRVVAAQAKADAEVTWKLKNRIKRLEHSDSKKEAMYAVGALPTTYFEYARMEIPYRGVVMENFSVPAEGFATQIDDTGTIGREAEYMGMNPDTYAADLINRVSTVTVTGAKQAVEVGALKPLMDGMDLSAATSVAAAGSAGQDAMAAAYSKLDVGDILIAWDNNAEDEAAPRLSVLAVTDVDKLNLGGVTVTYPAYMQPIYYFRCNKCGAIDTEGPSSAVLTQHVVSDSSAKFTGYAEHSKTDAKSSCTGKWEAMYGTTWRTEYVTYAQLFGAGDGVPYGGTRYLPYTLAAYSGEQPAVNVQVTTDATAENIAGGFTAKVSSNYAVFKAEAVLARSGSAGQTFPVVSEEYGKTMTFHNAELDRALFESITGSYTLTLNVWSGPAADANSVTAVTKAYTLDLSLDAPQFALQAPAPTVDQGSTVTVSVKTLVGGITGADVSVKYDTARFAFDAEATRKANSGATVSGGENGDPARVQRFGAALSKGATAADLVFRAVRTGDMPVDATETQPFTIFTAASSTKEGAAAADLTPARGGGDVCQVGIGYNVQIFKDYVKDYDLVLIHLEGGETEATYDGQSMLNVTLGMYEPDGHRSTYTHGIIVQGAASRALRGKLVDSSGSNIDELLVYGPDVNGNGSADIADAQTICNIISGKLPLEGNMATWLRADVDRNGKVDNNDVLAVMALLRK